MTVDEAATAQAAAWQKYLQQLEKDDPEEFKALQSDLEQFQRQLSEQTQPVINSPQDAAKLKQQQEDEASGEHANSNLPKIKLPGGDKKVLASDGVQTEEESIKVVPDPGFVVKTRDQGLKKVFINLCQSPLIQEMGTKKQLDQDGNEQEGLNIPLSLGPGLPGKDKAGKECVVYDIIVNPGVIENCSSDASGGTRAFLCNLAIEYVEQKYGCVLDRKYKLPRLKYKGNSKEIPYQLIRKRRAPVIEEVAKKAEKKAVVEGQKTRKQHALRYALRYETADRQELECEPKLSDPYMGDEESKLELSGTIVLHATLDTIPDDVKIDPKLELSPEFVVLSIPGFYKKLELFLPRSVSPEESSATYDCKTKAFVLRMPLETNIEVRDAWKNTALPDEGSRPWLLSNAIGREGSMPKVPKQTTEDQTRMSEKQDNDNILPEDRFHLNDLLSQHIKQERAQGREKREMEHAEKERVRAKEEAAKKKKEEAAAKEKALSEAKSRVLASKSKRTTITDSFSFKPEAEDLDLF